MTDWPTSDGPAVLYLRSSRLCTGLERRLVHLAIAATQAGLVPRLAMLYRPDPDDPREHPLTDVARQRGISATSIPDTRPSSAKTITTLSRLLRQECPTIIHTHDYRSDILAFILSRAIFPRPKLIATCHGHTKASPRLRVYETLDRIVLRHFDLVIGVSHYLCMQLLRWGIPSHQVVYIPHWVEEDWSNFPTDRLRPQIRAQLRIENTAPLIGYFGRHSPEKGFHLLFAAWKQLYCRNPKIKLLGAGVGLDALHSHSGATIFTGHQMDVRPYMAACDLIAVPSIREAFGLTALEASALGTAVVASRAGGLPEIIRDGVTGRLIPVGNTRALAYAIHEALDDWDMTRHMAARAQEDVQHRFAPCRIMPNAIALYHRLINGSS